MCNLMDVLGHLLSPKTQPGKCNQHTISIKTNYDLMAIERVHTGHLSQCQVIITITEIANGRQRNPIKSSASKHTGSSLCVMYVNGPCFHHLGRIVATPGASVESDGGRD